MLVLRLPVQAVLLMDLHAHLSSSEVIGLLGGVWDVERRCIDVVRAFPCRRALGSQSGTSVELDPAAEVETRGLMEAARLTPVGWCALPHLVWLCTELISSALAS
jgi:protein MYSM1